MTEQTIPPERRIESHALAERVDALKSTVDDLKFEMKELVKIISHLARIDERQMQSTATTDRLASEMDEMRKDLDALRQLAPTNAQTAVWFERALIAAAAAALMFMAKQTGLM